MDGRLLARAKDALDEKRRRNEELHERRRGDVYKQAPHIRELDEMLSSDMSKFIAVSLGIDNDEEADEIRLRNLETQEKRLAALKRAGFPEGYLDEDYMCGKCKDTGFVKTEICGCLMELYKKEQTRSLSSLLKLGDETFESFDLSYYDDTPSKGTGVSPRKSMEIIYEICVEYSRKFGNNSMNLFFNGAPGLGKTFLSACIARVVSEKGFSVVYDTVISAFSKFEDAKFRRGEEYDDARGETKRYLECDLLILDDLGTEMTTAFTVSALYEIINSRLIANRKTVVSSNLTLNDLQNRYSGQIMSRLEGEYQVLTFRGEDIRKQKNRY